MSTSRIPEGLTALMSRIPEWPAALTPRGPAWLAIRQHRFVLRIVLALTVTGALILIHHRISIGKAAAAFAATGCSTSYEPVKCDYYLREYPDSEEAFHALLQTSAFWIMVLPIAIGAFVAGPLIAREMESGTYRLAWTQSVTPAHWLAAKLLAVAAAALGCVALLTTVQSWAWATGPRDYYGFPWWDSFTYASIGIVPLAYTALGIAAGALVGLLVRRTVAAMSLTGLAVSAVLIVLGAARSILWPLVTVTNNDVPEEADGGWRIEEGLLTASGKRLPTDFCESSPDVGRCMADHGVSGRYLDYHPDPHFWPLQIVESGLVLALAAAASYGAFRVLRSHHG
ncbi:ABC transporter permease subunit [Streptomyces sp. NPDC088116]|uniref:ABC transporter permease subunit n=1 Tax=Streptomyces sp. NPDC088116 TaxID=3365825 RepID=UPI003811A522